MLNHVLVSGVLSVTGDKMLPETVTIVKCKFQFIIFLDSIMKMGSSLLFGLYALVLWLCL